MIYFMRIQNKEINTDWYMINISSVHEFSKLIPYSIIIYSNPFSLQKEL